MLISTEDIIATEALHVTGPGHSTMTALLRWRALNQSQRHAYTFLENGEEEGARWTYADLDRRARTIGAQLQRMGAAGQRALLLYQPGLEFVAAFFGCLYAGAIAIPAPPPRLNKASARLSSIIADAEPVAVLTNSSLRQGMQSFLASAPEAAGVSLVATEELPEELAEHWQEPTLDGETLAFFQYTSGSTTTPKGVMVTHSNILHNAEDIDISWAHTDESVIVSWLPHFHDMGLIYGVLEAVYRGIPSYLMAPAYFVQRPYRWLNAISRFGGTHTAAPNFAYDLCTRKISPQLRDTLDLSRWEVAVNGAEPVHQETLVEFIEYFRPSGFRATTFCPGYGLAEATLKVAASRNGEAPVHCNVDTAALERNCVEEVPEWQKGSRPSVGCGRPMMDTTVVIVDPETLEACLPDAVGEIWVSGSSIARGYWQRPEENERTFNARVAGTGEGPFLRTGDLGFLKDGHVYVTGRIKDLIIIDGNNHYPQDIELTVEKSHPAFRRGCSAAFGVEVGGEERLVVAVELDQRYRSSQPATDGEAGKPSRPTAGDLQEIARAAKRAVAEQHELSVHDLLLLVAGTIPKTSSGKIQRHASRAGYLNRTLEILGE
jgi:acyl-CoA synthetase (AMP-forming)/AMP-acid ligase II